MYRRWPEGSDFLGDEIILRGPGIDFFIQNFFNPDWNVENIVFFNNNIEKNQYFIEKTIIIEFFLLKKSIIIEKMKS